MAYDVIKNHGDEGIPVFFSEVGYSDYLDTGLYDTYADYMHKMFRLSEENFPWLWGITWFRMLDDPLTTEGNGSGKGYGIMKDPGSNYVWKPSAYTFDSFSENYPVPSNVAYSYDFDNLGSKDGFSSLNVIGFRSVGGLIYGSSNSQAPMIISPMVSINTDTANSIELRMSASCGDTTRFYFITDEDSAWDENKAYSLPLNGDSQPHTYVIRASPAESWKGYVKQFRFYPTNGACDFSIDSIRFSMRSAANIVSMDMNTSNPHIGDTVNISYVVENDAIDDDIIVKCGFGYSPERYLLSGYSQQKTYAMQSGEQKQDSCAIVADRNLFWMQDEKDIVAIVAGYHGDMVWDETKYRDISLFNPADTSEDGCIQISELTAFIGLWHIDSAAVTMQELMDTIRQWKNETDVC